MASFCYNANVSIELQFHLFFIFYSRTWRTIIVNSAEKDTFFFADFQVFMFQFSAIMLHIY